MARVEWLMWNALSKCAIAPLRELPQHGERQKLKEGSQRTRCKKGGKKPWITRLPVYCKEGGGSIFCLATVRQLGPVQYSTQSAHGGGVLSSTESTPVLQGSHYIVFTIVCNWGKKKKKRREQKEEKETCVFVLERLSRKVILWLFEFASIAGPFYPRLTRGQHLPLSLLLPNAGVTYGRSQTGKQRHPGYSWWWELTSERAPWILMWRIVCFIEEQREARWLPFRICERGYSDGLLEFLHRGATWKRR